MESLVETADNVTISEDLKIEFVKIYDDKEDDLSIAMNCSNGFEPIA